MKPVADFWDGASREYRVKQWEKDRISQFDFKLTKEALLRHLLPTKKDDILEIGCGPGKWSREVAQRCKSLVAIDISPKMVRNARAYCQRKNARFVVGDFVKTKIPGKFDKIFAVRVIEYAPDKGAFIRKAKSLLKPGGTIVIITKSKPCLWGLTKKVSGFWQEKISSAKLEQQFSKSGFVNINSKPIIIRLPIFKRGNREFPIVAQKNEVNVLKYFEGVSKRATNAKGMKKKLLLLLAESYITRAKLR